MFQSGIHHPDHQPILAVVFVLLGKVVT